MPTWFGLVLLVLLVASRPIEGRLWRAGRISDRTVTSLLIGRFPVVVGIAAWAAGGFTALTAALIAISLLPPLLFYRYTLSLIREQSARRGAPGRVEPPGAAGDIRRP
jgi:hypothetical protein